MLEDRDSRPEVETGPDGEPLPDLRSQPRRLLDKLKLAMTQASRQGHARVAADLKLICETVVEDERAIRRDRRRGEDRRRV
jgi:hypothetical protein